MHTLHSHFIVRVKMHFFYFEPPTLSPHWAAKLKLASFQFVNTLNHYFHSVFPQLMNKINLLAFLLCLSKQQVRFAYSKTLLIHFYSDSEKKMPSDSTSITIAYLFKYLRSFEHLNWWLRRNALLWVEKLTLSRYRVRQTQNFMIHEWEKSILTNYIECIRCSNMSEILTGYIGVEEDDGKSSCLAFICKHRFKNWQMMFTEWSSIISYSIICVRFSDFDIDSALV